MVYDLEYIIISYMVYDIEYMVYGMWYTIHGMWEFLKELKRRNQDFNRVSLGLSYVVGSWLVPSTCSPYLEFHGQS